MWKLARKTVADTSTLSPFYFPLRDLQQSICLHGPAQCPTAHCPVLLVQVRALHGAAGRGVSSARLKGGQEGEIYRKHLGITKLRKKSSRRLKFHIINS